ncbi:golvesin C-terminal-like domain-containing protein [Hypericibacter terrae]|nr:RHS repeat-associated core domain-containing protein [Hypericibacter terrae]
MNRATWTPTLSLAANYNVFAWWKASSDRGTGVPYTVYYDGGSSTVRVNQTANGGKWNLLGTYALTPGQNHRVDLTDQATGGTNVIADAVQITRVGAPPPTATWAPTLPRCDTYQLYVNFTGFADHASNAPYTIFYEGGSTTVPINQHSGYAGWKPLGSFLMAPGQNHRVDLTDIADGHVIADAVRFVPVSGTKSATWTLTPTLTASYRVYAKWPASAANATDAKYTVTYEGGSTTVTANQRVNGGQWNLLGTFPFNASGAGYKVDLPDTSASGKVVADAIYYVRDSAPVDSFTWTPDIVTPGDYQLYVRWTASSGNSGAAQYTVVHGGGTSLITLNQKQNGGQWNLLGTYSFAPSSGHQVTLTASGDGTVVADAIRLVGTGPAPADLVYLHTDQIGLPQKITHATKTVVWDRVQDPFGRQVSLTNSGGIDTTLRFPGQQADPDTGFAYNYFRDYDPTLGRYIQADPIGFVGGINIYAYAGGNPVLWVDEWGLETIFEYLTGLDDSYRVGALNAVAGWQDALTFGLANEARELAGLNEGVNSCSTTYEVGEWLGIGTSVVFGGITGLERAGIKGAGKEFSHWIPNRMGGPRSIWNGNYVTSIRHYYHDPFRYPRGWQSFGRKWPSALQQLDRIPYVYRGAAIGLGLGIAGTQANEGCECQQ